jgi:hypothetical protein
MIRRVTNTLSRRLGTSEGFSIVELVVAMLVTGLLTAGMLGIYVGVSRSSADSTNRMINQDDARTAMGQAERFIRMAQFSDSNLTSTSDAVALAASQELTFYADVDGDNHAERVRYYMSGQNLMMSTTEPDLSNSPPTYPSTPTSNSIVIMNGVVNGATPVFTYYQLDPNYFTNPIPGNDTLVVLANPTTTADLAKIAAVNLTLYVNENPAISKGSVKLDSMVQIRQRYNGGINGS